MRLSNDAYFNADVQLCEVNQTASVGVIFSALNRNYRYKSVRKPSASSILCRLTSLASFRRSEHDYWCLRFSQKLRYDCVVAGKGFASGNTRLASVKYNNHCPA